MSARTRRTWALVCDRCRTVYVDPGRGGIVELRAKAKADGWTAVWRSDSGYIDHCPACAGRL